MHRPGKSWEALSPVSSSTDHRSDSARDRHAANNSSKGASPAQSSGRAGDAAACGGATLGPPGAGGRWREHGWLALTQARSAVLSCSLPPCCSSPRDAARWAALGVAMLLVLFAALRSEASGAAVMQQPPSFQAHNHRVPNTLIAYSYFEKDGTQVENFEFFVRHGQPPASQSFFHTIYTVSGRTCTPCQGLIDSQRLAPGGRAAFPLGTVTASHVSRAVTLLRRVENVGMDFGNHNVSLAWLQRKDAATFRAFKFFVFLNSSVRGPFLPNYVAGAWHWAQAFTSLLSPRVKAVSPSLVCLPEADEGGPAPRLESFVFATDDVGLGLLAEAGALRIWHSKADIILNGEYGLTQAIFDAGYNVATLLYKYGLDVNWRDAANWGCNNQVHPSRECSYDGISQHPFETIFVKSSWNVSSAAVDKYSQWADDRLMRRSTQGAFDADRYWAAVRHEPMCGMKARQEPTRNTISFHG